MITPYALMMDDPTISVMICWIDEREAKDGEDHTLTYNGQSQQVGPWAELANGDYIYRADLTGLEPGTEYALTIDPGTGAEAITPVRTFPEKLPDEGVKILCVQDTHAVVRQMTSPATFAPMANEQVDAYVIFGDAIGDHNFNKTEADADVWKEGMRDYLLQVNKDYMPHIIQPPGNHEVGNTPNDGTLLGDATGTQFRQFFPNQYELTPADSNQSAIRIGDYLQILGGDCYSGYPSDVGDLIREHHDPDVMLCIFGAHSPMFSANDMRFVPQDNELQERMRNECFAQLASKQNVKFAHGGNIHIRSITYPLKFVTEDPQTADSFVVSGNNPGWIVRANPEDRDVLVEFGQGWQNNRAGTLGQWFFERDTRGEHHHFLIELKPGVVRQRSVAQDLSLYDDRSWRLPQTKGVTETGRFGYREIKSKKRSGHWRAATHRRGANGAWQ